MRFMEGLFLNVHGIEYIILGGTSEGKYRQKKNTEIIRYKL